MPKVSVAIPHNKNPDELKDSVASVLEQIIKDFQGHDLDIQWAGRNATFRFKSLAFTINGTLAVEANQVRVDVDLPFAAMMYKDRVQKGIEKHLSRLLGSESP